MKQERSSFATSARWFLPIAMLALALAPGCEKKSGPADVKQSASAASEEHYTNETKAEPKFVAAAVPATRPTKTLPRDATCITPECHANMATARQIHGPISARDCYSCHNEDIGGHKFPLKRKGNDTCTFCHKVSGTQAYQHAALEQGCTACHKPHASEAKFLLTFDNIERTCASCHETPLRKFAHEPFAKGECTTCHQPHQAANVDLLRGNDGPDFCFTCHKDMQQKLSTASLVHKPVKTDCVKCHSPHSTDNEHQLRQPQQEQCYDCHRGMRTKIKQATVKHGALVTGKGCANCHDSHAASEPRLLRARTDAVCLSCHDKPMSATDGHLVPEMKTVLTTSKFLHGPNRSGNCSACHDPHGAKEADLLSKALPKTFYTSFELSKYDLCFSCHSSELVLREKTGDLTGFRDGDRNLHYVHVHRDSKGRTCKSCHAVHGSNQPKHIAEEVPFEGSKWAMPIGYESTLDGGTCTPGCHDKKEYKRSAAATTRPTTRGGP